MPTPKLQPSRALTVIASPYCEIPFPNLIVDDTLSDVTDNLLTFSNPFVGVEVGDIVYSYIDNFAATVARVISDTELEVNEIGFISLASEVLIYKGGQNSGCVLYTGGEISNNIVVMTAGGDTVPFDSTIAGTFLPVNVIKLISSSAAANIIALW